MDVMLHPIPGHDLALRSIGWGREMGKEVLELYTETKAVAAAL